jgi:hypothetical protein
VAVLRKGPTISDRLRAAILAAVESRRRISLATGVAESVLSRFVRGQQGITLDTADLLAAHLGLDLLPAKQQDKKRGR